MKNVTKILTAVTLCAALFASDQRVEALGGNAALWPGDEANITAFPGSINDHALVQYSGVGNDADDPSETATVLFDKDGTTWGFRYDNSGDNWFNVMWGNGDMGLYVGMLSNENGATGCTNCREDSGFNLGWGQTMGFGDLGVTYSSTSKTENGTTDEEDNTSLGVNWRGDVGFWVFDSLTASYNMSDTDKTGTSDDSDSTTLSATAFSHMDANGADVLFGMGVTNMSGTEGTGTGSDKGYMHLNSTVAVEANMTDWATFRVGATFAYQLSGENDWTGAGSGTCWDATGVEQTCDGSEDSQDDGWGLGLGLGFNWGGFSADYTISQGFFNDPVSNITGYKTANLTDQAVTLTYSF